jgi:NAD+ kinase
VVSTPLGSSAYGLSAGGPLLAPHADAFVFTPLYHHGGACPAIVMPSGSELELAVDESYSGVRLEVDGQLADTQAGRLAIRVRPEVATVVGFADQEPFLTGLRRRQIITDSPRFLAEDGRR